MNINKEVYNRCKIIIEDEINSLKHKIRMNKRIINNTAEEQAVHKREIGELYKILRTFNIKNKETELDKIKKHRNID
jgi:hypothetical protein